MPKMDGTRGEITKATKALNLSQKVMESLRTKRYRLRHPEKSRESHLLSQRRYTLKTNFAMTYEEYQSMLQRQNGVCAICQQPPTVILKRNQTLRALAVDHDHSTGKIRGLLCDVCNRALGQFKDNPAILFRAILYLSGGIR